MTQKDTTPTMTSLALTLRQATPDDRAAILEISAEVWEGNDYVPDVLDAWLAPSTARLIVACAGTQVVAFARLDFPFPGYGWLEGLRTHADWRRRGVGLAIMAHLAEQARLGGATVAGAAIYGGNAPSMGLVERLGLSPVARFTYCEAGIDAPLPTGEPSDEVEPVTAGEAENFVRASSFLRTANGYFSHDWRFYRFELGPAMVIGRMRHLLGIRKSDGRLAALLCAGRSLHGPLAYSIDFLEGEPDAMSTLARHAVHLAGPCKVLMAMVPQTGAEPHPALAALAAAGIRRWEEDYDVLVVERELTGG